MLSKHWKYRIAILTPLVVLKAIFLPAFAQNPSILATAQCTNMEIQKYIQQLNKAETSDFDALVACQSKAVPALIKALKNEDENIRIMIIAALGEIGSQASPAVPFLNELLVRDRSSDVQSITVHALRKINRGRVPVLITNLKSKDWRVRYQAAHTLGQIGTEAKDAVPALTVALEDEIQPVRSSAANALQKITQIWHADSDTVMSNTANHVNNNPPAMCRIPAIRAVLRWKCP
ncbi:MAG: HEAT repeat domain-containing protein [Brasilonema sp.]